jgi:tetratricopeptide (TPR) repeat protein
VALAGQVRQRGAGYLIVYCNFMPDAALRAAGRVARVAVGIYVAGGLWAAMADPGDALDTKGGGVDVSYVIHAQAAINEGRLSEAIAYCDKAIAAHPAFIRAHFDRGRALLAAGRFAEPVVEFNTVIAAHPEYAMVYEFRGQAYLLQGKTDEAITDLNAAVSARVGVGPVRYADILLVRSLAWELAGRPEPAVADLEHGMKAINGNTFSDYHLLNDRCYIAAVAGLLDSAEESCEDSVARHARNEEVYDSFGLMDLKKHAWDKAIADYTQSLYYRPNLTYSLYGRGVAKRAKGDAAGAAADMAAAEANEPRIGEIMTRLGVSSAAPGGK